MELGQKLWYVPHQRGVAREVTITKIGRKWITIGEDWSSERLDKETLRADGKGYSSPGRCYIDRADYEKSEAIANAWSKLKSDIAYSSAREGVSLVDIERAKVLLKL